MASFISMQASPMRSEEHTSELQSHRDLHSFPTRRSSDPMVELSDGDSLASEVGARVGTPLPHGELYLDAGVAHEFLGEMQADVSGLTFSNDLPGTVGLVSAGLTTRAAEDRLLLTLETGYAKGPEAEEFTATGNFWIKF